LKPSLNASPFSVNFDLRGDRFKVLSVWNISPGIFIAVPLFNLILV